MDNFRSDQDLGLEPFPFLISEDLDLPDRTFLEYAKKVVDAGSFDKLDEADKLNLGIAASFTNNLRGKVAPGLIKLIFMYTSDKDLPSEMEGFIVRNTGKLFSDKARSTSWNQLINEAAEIAEVHDLNTLPHITIDDLRVKMKVDVELFINYSMDIIKMYYYLRQAGYSYSDLVT